MGRVNFALVLHNHQPVGNFDKVFQMACERAYEPFLAELERAPQVRLTLHFSGCLMEWIEKHRPDLLERVAALVSRQQVELMGGGFYEPIFTMLPREDCIGQVQMYREYLEKRFGCAARGVWVPERVWEQSLASILAETGAEYAVLDDSHFVNVGLPHEALNGSYITEDEGRILRLFPASERLRYYIPYAHPEETLRYLASYANDEGDAVVVYGDDGEKFGIWPRTYKHVYEDGWLQQFLHALTSNLHWVNLITLSEAVDRFPPRGKIYLSDASYREMMEWALPPERIIQYEDFVQQLKERGLLEQSAGFVRGGSWRNFKRKYPEANRMYSRMLRVSRRVAALGVLAQPAARKAAAEARRELYRGQCNCAYWHGVFGGLYLAHLRSAVHEHLLAAEQVVERATHKSRRWLDVVEDDLDCDGQQEVLLSTAALRAFFKPSDGGHLYELDIAPKGLNVLDTLARHREGYHRKVPLARVLSDDEEVRSIHDIILAKEPGLEKRLHYDWYLREGFIDHFLADSVTPEQFERAAYAEIGDFVLGAYEHSVSKAARSASLALIRRGTVWVAQQPLPVEVRKTITIDRDQPTLKADYSVTNLSEQTLRTRFGVEFSFGLRAAASESCWYFGTGPHDKLGSLTESRQWESLGAISVADRDYGLNVVLRWKRPAAVWAFPVLCVSQSEAGFELSYQCSSVAALWQVELPAGGRFDVIIEKTVELL